jgi:hypothetical protein
LPEHFIKQFDVDYGISGEGEAALLAIVNGLHQGKPLTKGIVMRAVPLKDIQYTRGTWGYLDHYREFGVWGNLQSKRGCNSPVFGFFRPQRAHAPRRATAILRLAHAPLPNHAF